MGSRCDVRDGVYLSPDIACLTCFSLLVDTFALAHHTENPAKMSSGINEKKFDPELNDQGVVQHETLSDKELLQASYEAETRENEMGVWEAVKDHPMACFWAFVFCFTIVS